MNSQLFRGNTHNCSSLCCVQFEHLQAPLRLCSWFRPIGHLHFMCLGGAFRLNHRLTVLCSLLRCRLEQVSQIVSHKKSLVKYGDRNERIRTYNFPQVSFAVGSRFAAASAHRCVTLDNGPLAPLCSCPPAMPS